MFRRRKKHEVPPDLAQIDHMQEALVGRLRRLGEEADVLAFDARRHADRLELLSDELHEIHAKERE